MSSNDLVNFRQFAFLREHRKDNVDIKWIIKLRIQMIILYDYILLYWRRPDGLPLSNKITKVLLCPEIFIPLPTLQCNDLRGNRILSGKNLSYIAKIQRILRERLVRNLLRVGKFSNFLWVSHCKWKYLKAGSKSNKNKP